MIDEFRVEGILAASFFFRLSEADQGYSRVTTVKVNRASKSRVALGCRQTNYRYKCNAY